MTPAAVLTDLTQGWSSHREIAESLGARLEQPALGTRMTVTTPDGATASAEWDGDGWRIVRDADKIAPRETHPEPAREIAGGLTPNRA